MNIISNLIDSVKKFIGFSMLGQMVSLVFLKKNKKKG
jgi:hypothetical protein